MSSCASDAKNKAYMALVRPHLECCSPVWSSHQQSNNEKLEKVQKRAIRWVCNTKWDKENHKWSTSYKNLCKSRNWPTLKVRRTLLTCCQLYKIIHKLDCIEFSKYFGYRSRSRLQGHSLNFLYVRHALTRTDTLFSSTHPIHGTVYHQIIILFNAPL